MAMLEELQGLARNTRQEGLNQPHIVADDIAPLFDRISQNGEADVSIVGHSHNGKAIHLVKIGQGKKRLFAWSQMHGDEPTATASLFDIVAIVGHQQEHFSVQHLLSQFTLYLLPMLNPDGAQLRTRENAQGIDINRDALALKSPEAKILHNLIEKLKPDVAFNLHDQSRYYACGLSKEPVNLAYLCPPADPQYTCFAHRHIAMALISRLVRDFQSRDFNIARYEDDYTPSAFGEYVSEQGIPCILIESASGIDDPNRQVARQLTTESLLLSLYWLLDPSLENEDTEIYQNLPINREDGLRDLIFRGVTLLDKTNHPKMDVAINLEQHSNLIRGVEFGCCAHLGAFHDVSSDRLCWREGKMVRVASEMELNHSDYQALLAKGMTRFNDPDTFIGNLTGWPINISTKDSDFVDGVLLKAGVPQFAIINGQLIDLLNMPK